MKQGTEVGANPAQDQDKLLEALSALMDDEADELELRRILREMSANPELSGAWQRYHAIRASLHHEIHSKPSVNLLDGINARLAADEVSSHPIHFGRRLLRSGVLRHLGQGAIAASVAVAVLISVSLLDTARQDAPATNSVAESGVPQTNGTPVLNGDYSANAADLARTVATDDEALNRLEEAVYQEFAELPLAEEIPVSNYSPVFAPQPGQDE